MVEFFYVITWIAILWALYKAMRSVRRSRTRARGSRYYVPRFSATFDEWQPKWSPTHRWYSLNDHKRWQHEFDALARKDLPGRGSTRE
jgi:hypothetical protein